MRTNKNKHQQRRLCSNNVISFGKSSCRASVTSRTLGSLHSSFYNNQGTSYSCITKAKNNVIKIQDYKKKKQNKSTKGSN